MNKTQRRFALAVVAVGALVIVVWGVPKLMSTGPKKGPSAGGSDGRRRPRTVESQPASAPVPPPARTQPAISPFPTTRKVGPAERVSAAALLERGLGLAQRGQLVAARGDVADALWCGGLDEKQADVARAQLAELGNKTILSRTIYPDDPVAVEYTVKSGDVLVNVERALKLHVPTELVVKINGLASATRLRPGQRLKMIRGPFHALISKSRFTMDVYLQEYGTGRMIFVRRFPVGTGQDGATPPGAWRVALGGKLRNAAWTPPSSSPLPRKKILKGEPGYALGKGGLWISLEGIDGNPYTSDDAYGIHDTNDQNSIGTNTSLGCIRMRDGDIDLAFSMLYEFWSTVMVED